MSTLEQYITVLSLPQLKNLLQFKKYKHQFKAYR